jgi:serine/threonine-protein kinase
MTPASLGRYLIADRIGQGAMGVVYRARDPIIDRVVALKTIDPHLSGEALREFNERFFHEAKSAGRLGHPNIVTIYDAGEAGGVAYIAMEYLEGPSLRQILDDHPPLAISRILEIGAQVARGLAYAHEHGVVHSDVKPANVILVNGRRPKLTDFGIARVAGAPTGELAGSPKYMSPEQVRGEPLDGRTDIFSLGAVLYELLTGKQPFTGEDVSAIVKSVLEHEPPPPSALDPRVPAAVDKVVARMLAKRVEDRYTSARRVMRHLAELADVLGAEDRGRVGPELPLARPAREPGGEETTVVLGAAEAAAPPSRRGFALAAAALALAVAVGLVIATREEAADVQPPAARAVPAAPAVAVAPPVASPLAEVPAAAPEKAIEPPPAAPAAPAARTAAPRPARKPAPAPAPVAALPDPEPLPKALPTGREVATLQLAVSPWGEVFIDGESRGTTPPLSSIQVAPGNYRVEVRNSTLVPYRVDVSVGSGDTRRIKHRFE